MESKICTYTEDNIRLQLVKIDNNTGNPVCEIRINRKTIFRVSRSNFSYFGTLARLMFLHYVHEICLDRNSSNLLHLTM